jgi:multidrug efflux system outer membrane protein
MRPSYAVAMRKVVTSLFVAISTTTAAAFAQMPAPRPAAAPSPSASASATALAAEIASAAPPSIPPELEQKDPMLAPVPRAKREVATWEEALGLLKSRSTDLKTAYDEVRRAEGLTRSALSQLLLQVNGTGAYTHQFITTTESSINTNTTPPSLTSVTFPAPNTWSGSITFQQPLFNLPNYDEWRIQKIGVDVDKLAVGDLKRTLALGVANSIVGVVTAERVAELNRNGVRQALDTLELTKKKNLLGAATGLDVVRAAQDVESARATLVTGDESLRQAREALGLALGIPEGVGVSSAINLAGLERSALEVCKASPSLDDRPDVAEARLKLEVAKRNVRNVWYQFMPVLNAQSTAADSSTSTAISATQSWNIQAVLSVPIWDGGNRYGLLKQTRALEDEAIQALEALKRTASIQIEQAHRGVDVADQSRKVALSARDFAHELNRLTQLAYLQGQGTSLDLVVASAGMRQADINLALQEFALVKARILDMLSLATCPW